MYVRERFIIPCHDQYKIWQIIRNDCYKIWWNDNAKHEGDANPKYDIDIYRANTNRKYKKWYMTKEFTGLVAGFKLSFFLIVILFDPLVDPRSINRVTRKSHSSRVNRVRNDVAEKLPDGWSIYRETLSQRRFSIIFFLMII